jgi:hypothetical protein
MTPTRFCGNHALRYAGAATRQPAARGADLLPLVSLCWPVRRRRGIAVDLGLGLRHSYEWPTGLALIMWLCMTVGRQ